jgi:hypothetical protein
MPRAFAAANGCFTRGFLSEESDGTNHTFAIELSGSFEAAPIFGPQWLERLSGLRSWGFTELQKVFV